MREWRTCNVAGRSGFFLTLNVLKDLMVRVMKTEGREGGRRWSAEKTGRHADPRSFFGVENGGSRACENRGCLERRLRC